MTIPVAVYVTRFVASYELLDAAFAIPLGAGIGLVAIVLARRAARRGALQLAQPSREGVVRTARGLGIAGVCMAFTALISVAVYGLLEYAGTRD